jgi:hypothetical protein
MPTRIDMGLPNMRIKLSACGTRSHGKEHRLTHSAGYPRRSADNKFVLSRFRGSRSLTLFSLLFLAIAANGCFPGLCSNEEIKRAPSADRLIDAVLFQRDCGTTTGFSTQVSVVQHAAALPEVPSIGV